MGGYRQTIANFDLASLDTLDARSDVLISATVVAATDTGRDLAQNLVATHAGRNVVQHIAKTNIGRDLAQSLNTTPYGPTLAASLADTDAGRGALAQVLNTTAGWDLAQSLTRTDAGRDLALSLATTDAGWDLALSLATTTDGREQLHRLARTDGGRAVAQSPTTPDLGRNLVQRLASTTAGGRGLIQSLTTTTAGRDLAQSLTRTDAGRDLFSRLVPTELGRDLAQSLANTAAGRDLAQSLQDDGQYHLSGISGPALLQSLAPETRHLAVGLMRAIALMMWLVAAAGIALEVAVVGFVAGVATIKADDEIEVTPASRLSDPSFREPATDVGEVIAPVVTVEQLDGESTEQLGTTVEPLVGQVRLHLQDGSWSSDNGFPLGLEEDIEQDLAALAGELNPLSGRKGSSSIIQLYVTRLGEYVLDLAAKQATGQAQQRVDQLRQDALVAVSDISDTPDDVTNAIATVTNLAYSTAWSEMEKASDVDQAEWDAFIANGERFPIETATDAMGWRRNGGAEIASGALGAMTTGGGVATFANSVATWVGTTETTVAAISTITGAVAAVIGAILGVIAARYVTKD